MIKKGYLILKFEKKSDSFGYFNIRKKKIDNPRNSILKNFSILALRFGKI